MPEIARLSRKLVTDSLEIAATLCDGQVMGLTFQLTQVDETQEIQLTPHQYAQIVTLAKIEMARELSEKIRSLAQ